MVTVKRKINSETERYGGFSEIEVKTPAELNTVGDSFLQAQKKQAEQSINYSPSMRTVSDRQDVRQDYSAPVTNPTPDEIMPRIHSTDNAQKVEEKKEKAAVQKIDSRTKMILGVYLAIIVLLSALVIATGIFLTSTGARVDALQDELAAKNVVYNEQLSQIERLNDQDSIIGRAHSNGMEKIESAEHVDLLPLGDVPTYEGTTNWFDSFCDWLSGVFGG